MSRKLLQLEVENFHLKVRVISLERQLADAQALIQAGHGTDILTKLTSRLGIEDKIDHHLSILRRELMSPTKDPGHFSVLFIDLDDFGKVNKKKSHQDGDIVLQAFADYLRASTRSGDIVARRGGDEFIILAPNTNLAQSKKLAAKIEVGLKTFPFTHPDGSSISLSASIGSASTSEGLMTKDDLDYTADKRMTARKNRKKMKGRAQVKR